MTASILSFMFILFNIVIFLSVSKVASRIDKKQAAMFAVLALILSFLPWVKMPAIDSFNTQGFYQAY